jgi:hypothetical protein
VNIHREREREHQILTLCSYESDFLSFFPSFYRIQIAAIITTALKAVSISPQKIVSSNYLVKKMSLLSYIFMMTKAKGSKPLTAQLYKEHVLYKFRKPVAQHKKCKPRHTRAREIG